MKSIVLTEEIIRQGSLILVNPTHPLQKKEDLNEDALFPPHPDYPHIKLQKQSAYMLHALIHFLNGFQTIIPVSGYRTLAEQTHIYTKSLQEHGTSFTTRFVARPGCSEHQTGLAIDLAEAGPDIDFIRPAFPRSGLCQTFRAMAARYGFIERYRAGKETVTKIAAEPWHFRYVGYPHAVLMEMMGLTLEEYIAHLQTFPLGGTHWKKKISGRSFELFHVPIGAGETVSFHLPDESIYLISGDNDRGAVVALWRGLL